MKLLGIILIFLSAGYAFVLYRQAALRTIYLLREVADDLSLLQYRICVQRCSLPKILAEDLGQGLSGKYLWKPLAVRLACADRSFSMCWGQCMNELPLLIARRLSPLGKLLSVGGTTLAEAVDEIRGELLQLARERQERQAVNLRLSAAVCFSMAALFVLVVI